MDESHNIQQLATEWRLIHSARKLFSELGYDVTSTRMIANDAGVAQSAISFHFGTKENLCKAVIEYTIKLISDAYNLLDNEIIQCFNNDNMTKETAWAYLDQLLKKQISYSFNPKNKITINLVLREYTFPQQLIGILSNSIYDKIEGQLSRLIMTVTGKKDIFWASVISRAINGAIFTFTEKPILMENVLHTSLTINEEKLTEDYLHNYIIQSIHGLIPADDQKAVCETKHTIV